MALRPVALPPQVPGSLWLGSMPGRFEAWFTHMFVLSELAGENTGSGEGLVLRATRAGTPEVLARLNIG